MRTGTLPWVTGATGKRHEGLDTMAFSKVNVTLFQLLD